MKLQDYQLNNLSNTTVRQSIDVDDKKILLLNDDQIPPKREGVKNLIAIDNSNNVIWIADLPDGSLFSSYWTMEIKNNELYALCGSFLCKIDIETGKVLNIQFVK